MRDDVCGLPVELCGAEAIRTVGRVLVLGLGEGDRRHCQETQRDKTNHA